LFQKWNRMPNGVPRALGVFVLGTFPSQCNTMWHMGNSIRAAFAMALLFAPSSALGAASTSATRGASAITTRDRTRARLLLTTRLLLTALRLPGGFRRRRSARAFWHVLVGCLSRLAVCPRPSKGQQHNNHQHLPCHLNSLTLAFNGNVTHPT
jgi:hypothetical protein